MDMDIAVKTLDELVNEVDTTIRSEFPEYGDRLDEVIMLIRTTDRSDVALLTSQMGRMQAIVELGTQCTCEVEARWHACLGRVAVALAGAAQRFNMESVRIFCESMGIDHEQAIAVLKEMSEAGHDGPLPPLPDNIEIPNDPSELTE